MAPFDIISLFTNISRQVTLYSIGRIMEKDSKLARRTAMYADDVKFDRIGYGNYSSIEQYKHVWEESPWDSPSHVYYPIKSWKRDSKQIARLCIRFVEWHVGCVRKSTIRAIPATPTHVSAQPSIHQGGVKWIDAAVSIYYKATKRKHKDNRLQNPTTTDRILISKATIQSVT